ncbi:hypothetical protein CI784_15020 [Arthrobacter agilis]|nr:hypothetical protein B8W74_14990 [Arthrobacter agilis]PPB45382.1 hypothetical protein CI784_15020 [Arthrobacter agilis]
MGSAMSDNNPGSQGGSPDGQNQPQYGQNSPDGQSQPQYGQSLPDGQSQPQYGQSLPDGQSQPQYGQSLPDGQSQPQYGQQSASPYGQQSQSPYGHQGGNNYPGNQGYQGQVAENPGRTLGIVGFILAIVIAPVGLIISIVAFVKSRKARMGNGFALAGIIIGVLFTIGLILIVGLIAAAAPLIQEVAQACEGVASGGTVTVQGQTVTCP